MRRSSQGFVHVTSQIRHAASSGQVVVTARRVSCLCTVFGIRHLGQAPLAFIIVLKGGGPFNAIVVLCYIVQLVVASASVCILESPPGLGRAPHTFSFRTKRSSTMAAADVMTAPAMPKPTFRPIIRNTATKRKLVNVDFDPKVHLAFEPPEQILMMEDIGYSETTGVSPVAVSQPFRLFSPEAVQNFRDEVLSQRVMSSYRYESNLAACQLRGYVPKSVSGPTNDSMAVLMWTQTCAVHLRYLAQSRDSCYRLENRRGRPGSVHELRDWPYQHLSQVREGDKGGARHHRARETELCR